MYQLLFATPPLHTSLYTGDENFSEYVNSIEYGINPNNLSKQIDNRQSVDTHVLDQLLFQDLRKYIQKVVDAYVVEVFTSDQKLRITQSWVNKNEKNTIHPMHYHSNSILSGVFFFDSHDCNLKFFSDLKEQITLSNKQPTPYNSSVFDLPIKKNMLALFPSSVNHAVSLNMTDKVRYSLSFNTFPIGDLGSVNQLTHVSL